MAVIDSEDMRGGGWPSLNSDLIVTCLGEEMPPLNGSFYFCQPFEMFLFENNFVSFSAADLRFSYTFYLKSSESKC